jgi:KRAB domain-containing zinc finger protein
VCLNSFASKSYLRIHIKVHTGEKPFKCTVCSKLFLRSGQLKSHMRTHSDKLMMR